MLHAGKMLRPVHTSDVSEFAVSKLQYHENERVERKREREMVWRLYGGEPKRGRGKVLIPPAVRSWNNSLLIICIIWAEIDTVRNKIIEIIIRHKVDTMLEICSPNETSVNAVSCSERKHGGSRKY